MSENRTEQRLPFGTIEHAFEWKELVIHPVSDVHIGAPGHDARRLKEKIAAIRKAGANHRVLLMGDLADVNAPTNKHFDPSVPTTPQMELDMLVETFKPIADRVDLIIPGNHEDRLARVGLDYTAQFAALIGRPAVYRPLPTVARYTFHADGKLDKGVTRYRAHAELYVHHGYGGGRKEGGKLDKVIALSEQKPDCAAYLMGHVHTHASTHDEVPIGWPARLRRRLYVITGTYLGSADYAVKQAYRPGSTGSPTIRLVLSRRHDDEEVVALLETA